jgi:hypothetical protein
MIKESIGDKMEKPVIYDVENLIARYSSTKSQRSYTKTCDQNGQLREWLRPEQVELREAVKRVLGFMRSYLPELSDTQSYNPEHDLEYAFKNLKPPETNL